MLLFCNKKLERDASVQWPAISEMEEYATKFKESRPNDRQLSKIVEVFDGERLQFAEYIRQKN